MNEHEEEPPVFEIALVCRKRARKEEEAGLWDAVEVLVNELKKAGLIIERVPGLGHEFIKLSASLEVLGKAAAELQIRKRTRIGMDLAFEWEQVKAFVLQNDGSLFSWRERYHCYLHLLYGIVNKSKSAKALEYDNSRICWQACESLLQRLEKEGILKQVFPLHDERKKKEMLRKWAFNWWDLSKQPLDDIYQYFGTKIAMYFAFLGMYTRWLLFPAGLGIVLELVDFG